MASQAVDANLTGMVREEWDGGGLVDMRVDAERAVDGWTVAVDVGGEIVNIWNATVISGANGRYVLGPAPYNAVIEAGGAVEFGFEVAGVVTLQPLRVEVTLAEPDAAARELADGATDAAAGAGDPGEAPPTWSVATEDVREPAPFLAPDRSFAETPLSTRGTEVIDANGASVTLHGLNWFGLETEIFTPHGFWARNWREMMDEVRELGFNALRLPYSGAMVLRGGEVNGIDTTLNPDLEGLTGLEILDRVVAYAEVLGIGILLDYHRGEPGAGPNDNGLWYGNGHTEADLIAAWQALAERYADAPHVFGADLLNEPHAATWGDGSATDWAAAAERIGNAIHEVAPHWLIVVEGIAVHQGDTYWWGGNLQGVRERPVELAVPDKLAYSPHDYPPSVHPQAWFRDGSDLNELMTRNWGYLIEEGIAPVILGEWGSRLVDPRDAPWASAISAYLTALDVPWFWWSLNPNSEDTGGIYADDWTTVRPEVVTFLEPFLNETRPMPMAEIPSTMAQFTIAFTPEFWDAAAAGAAQDPNGTGASADRTTAEDDGGGEAWPPSVTFATVDGTAIAGRDYRATAGTVLLEPGTSEIVVEIPVFADAVADDGESFDLVVTGPGNERMAATLTIIDAEAPRRAGLALPPALPTGQAGPGASQGAQWLGEAAVAAAIFGSHPPAPPAAERTDQGLGATGGIGPMDPGVTGDEPGEIADAGPVAETPAHKGGDPDDTAARFSLELKPSAGPSPSFSAPAHGETAAPTKTTELTIERIFGEALGASAEPSAVPGHLPGARGAGPDLPHDSFVLTKLWSELLLDQQLQGESGLFGSPQLAGQTDARSGNAGGVVSEGASGAILPAEGWEFAVIIADDAIALTAMGETAFLAH